MSHLKVPVSKSMEETMVTKDRRSCSYAKCWTQVCLMLQTIFSFFVNVLPQSKSNGNRKKRKTYSRKRSQLVTERSSTQVLNLTTCIYCSFKYHDRVIVPSTKSWFWHYWDRIRASLKRPVIQSFWIIILVLIANVISNRYYPIH